MLWKQDLETAEIYCCADSAQRLNSGRKEGQVISEYCQSWHNECLMTTGHQWSSCEWGGRWGGLTAIWWSQRYNVTTTTNLDYSLQLLTNLRNRPLPTNMMTNWMIELSYYHSATVLSWNNLPSDLRQVVHHVTRPTLNFLCLIFQPLFSLRSWKPIAFTLPFLLSLYSPRLSQDWYLSFFISHTFRYHSPSYHSRQLLFYLTCNLFVSVYE